MPCKQCRYDLPAESNFCLKCGFDQRLPTRAEQTQRPLRRSVNNRKVAGICGGIAEHLHVDVALIRVLAVVVTLVPGAVVGGVLAYLVLWLFLPSEDVPTPSPVNRYLTRSAANCNIAGVCGGLGEYLGVDPTFVRVLWVVLSIVPGFIVGGVVAYVIAWMIMPRPQVPSSVVTQSDQVWGV